MGDCKRSRESIRIESLEMSSMGGRGYPYCFFFFFLRGRGGHGWFSRWECVMVFLRGD